MNHSLVKVHFLLVCFPVLLASLFANSVTVPENFPTIGTAMLKSKKGDTILVNEGLYKEQLFVAPGVTLLSKKLFGAILDGGGRETVVTVGNGATISGFEVRNGTIGVFSTSAKVSIVRCKITQNQQTGIMCVGNLPLIEDNLVIYNNGSGLQGWDVRSTSASINHNTISFNGNHGIAIGGNSTIIIENNIISNNEQFGLKVSDESVRITLVSNNFYLNAKFTGALPNENYSFAPMFTDSGRNNFMLDKSSQLIGKGTDNQDLGARIVY